MFEATVSGRMKRDCEKRSRRRLRSKHGRLVCCVPDLDAKMRQWEDTYVVGAFTLPAVTRRVGARLQAKVENMLSPVALPWAFPSRTTYPVDCPDERVDGGSADRRIVVASSTGLPSIPPSSSTFEDTPEPDVQIMEIGVPDSMAAAGHTVAGATATVSTATQTAKTNDEPLFTDGHIHFAAAIEGSGRSRRWPFEAGEVPQQMVDNMCRPFELRGYAGHLDRCNAVLPPGTMRFTSVGLHPRYANSWSSLAHLIKLLLATRPEAVAVSETGLDDTVRIPLVQQLDAMREQAYLAISLGKPLILHICEANENSNVLASRAYRLLDAVGYSDLSLYIHSCCMSRLCSERFGERFRQPPVTM